MEITLQTGETVELLDYYSQEAHEANHEALAEGKMKMTNAPITDDDILEELGIDVLQEIREERDETKQAELRFNAEHKIRSLRLTSSVGVADYHRAEKAKIAAMVILIDGEDMELDEKKLWLKRLRQSDYEKLQKYVIEKQDEADAEKKSS